MFFFSEMFCAEMEVRALMVKRRWTSSKGKTNGIYQSSSFGLRGDKTALWDRFLDDFYDQIFE